MKIKYNNERLISDKASRFLKFKLSHIIIYRITLGNFGQS